MWLKVKLCVIVLQEVDAMFWILLPFSHCLCFWLSSIDTAIVQVQQWLVVGSQRVEQQVLLNKVPLTGKSQEFQNIIKTISSDVLPPSVISVNQTSALSKKINMR